MLGHRLSEVVSFRIALEVFGHLVKAFIDIRHVEIAFVELISQIFELAQRFRSIDVSFLQVLNDLFKLLDEFGLIELFGLLQQLLGLTDQPLFFRTQ